ncbi:hypothetical protein E4U41_002298 [Claviceps citrina]|nr:hypothetical protein E4U41_002298 [Claviceps citrina]
MTTTDIIHAYRHLYRSLLRAVQYASPARYIARDQLRRAFREGQQQQAAPSLRLNTEGVKRTVWFLEAAARERGLEHRIVKNLLRVAGERAGRRDGLWRVVYARSKQK